MVLSHSSFVKRRFLLRPNTVRVCSRGKKLVFLAEKATLPDSGHFNFENIEMPWRPRERTPAPEAKAGPRSRRASAVAAGRLTDDDSNESLKTASALKLAQFQSESALEQINLEMLRIPKLKTRLLRRLAMLSSPVKLEDSLTGEATAQITCACGFVARGCYRSLVRAFQGRNALGTAPGDCPCALP